MIYYDLGPHIEAFSTNIGDNIDFEIVTPEHQAHSTNVAVLPQEIDKTYGVDALITSQKRLRIGIRTADCVPILVADRNGKCIAAIHSGWKGTVLNIISYTITRLIKEYGVIAEELNAVIGPCIHIEAFEVGDEVYDIISDNGYAKYAKRMSDIYGTKRDEKWHIDLPAVCHNQLKECGVKNIQLSGMCTYLYHDTLYSYRYTGLTGRQHRIYNCIMIR